MLSVRTKSSRRLEIREEESERNRIKVLNI